MAKEDRPGAPSRNTAMVLSEVDRALLEQMRERIAERSQIRRTSAQESVGGPHETKRTRLHRNQQQLEELFDEAIARPAVARALKESGYEADALRQAGTRGTWARDVTPAISAAHSKASRELEQQRRDAVAQAARAMIDLRLDQPEVSADRWLDDLERGVRANLGGKRPSNQQVAQRLVEWAEEAMSAVSHPVATAARTMLIERAFEGELGGDAQGRDRLAPALRVALERAGMNPGTIARGEESTGAREPVGSEARPVTQKGAVEAPAESNWISAPDDAESVPGRRQVADLTEVAQRGTSTPTATDPGLFARLRGLWATKEQSAPPERANQAGEDETLPDALRRRYAVHVSDDGRTIELFEAGAKTPAITLDAKSISTKHNDGAVIADVILLARDRGWQALKVSGTAEFKDAVWLEASKAGLVAQHEPSSAARAAFAKWDQDRPANQVQHAAPSGGQAPRRDDGLAQAFATKSAEERLADPRLRNAQLELMVGVRTAERELKRPIAEMPEVAQALTAAIREQLKQGRVFEAPFVVPDAPRRAPKQASSPKIEADRIASPRV